MNKLETEEPSFDENEIEGKEYSQSNYNKSRFELKSEIDEGEEKEKENHIKELMKKIFSFKKSKKQEEKPKEKQIKQLDTASLKKLKEKEDKRDKRLTNLSDFIPVIGSIKMIAEGLQGKQYLTEKEIKGGKRFFHTLFGALFLGLDITGIGAIASGLGKGAIKIGERLVLEEIGEGIEKEVLEKETAKLATRGDKRIEKQEKISDSCIS